MNILDHSRSPNPQLRSKAVQIASGSSILAPAREPQDPQILRPQVIVSGPLLALSSITYLESDAVTLTIPLSTNLLNHSCFRISVCLP